MWVKFLSAMKNQSKNQSLTSKSGGRCPIMGHMMVQEQNGWPNTHHIYQYGKNSNLCFLTSKSGGRDPILGHVMVQGQN